MNSVSLIILSAGNSTRFKSPVKKQWLRINSVPLWLFVVRRFQKMGLFEKIVVVASAEEKELMKFFIDEEIEIIEGGSTRQNSLKNALNSENVTSDYVMVTDVARACVSESSILETLNHKTQADVIVPYLSVTDTVVFQENTINRDEVKLIQTPQLSIREKLKNILNSTEIQYTDESTALAENGFSRFFVKGDSAGIKITYLEEIKKLNCFQLENDAFSHVFVGNGFDVHKFESRFNENLKPDENRKVILGGIKIDEFPLSFKAHSDGDVLIHSLIDAILGGASIGDIGTLFPDTDDKYKDIDSQELLKYVVKKVYQIGLEIVHIDVTVVAEAPKLMKYKQTIKLNLAKIIGLELHQINIKATTTEKLGFIGRKEGVGVISTATLKNFDWRKL